MYAVIETGGKQYKVSTGDVIEIEKLEGDSGDKVDFSNVLMVNNNGGIAIGAPIVEGAVVNAEIVAQVKGEKLIIFKKNRRKNYRRKNGHRQCLTSVKIKEIKA